ncbi:MAG: phage/plasmid primase, P4 family [Pseudolabrys sp.]|nr:phage/plasmid primase, P4 family [Pseudolabrys sp.]MDP2295460.1 phage/plasmid primase, P4 family [Pseudolabrys sp.]
MNKVTRPVTRPEPESIEQLAAPPRDFRLPVVLQRKDWVTTAEKFRQCKRPTLLHWNGDFLDYRKGAYHELEDLAVMSDIVSFFNWAVVRVQGEDGGAWVERPYDAEPKQWSALFHALKCESYTARDEMAPPCWLNDAGNPSPLECISLQNCILHVPTRKCAEPTPNFFTRNALNFDYDPDAACPLWLNTLEQYWPSNLDSTTAGEVFLLQEIMGYLLLPDTSLQKIFVLLGPGRSGKGTIARVITMLLGELNVAASSLQALAQEPFGRQPLIAKTAAIISEAAIGPKIDKVTVTGHLKAISGEDNVQVDRKNRVSWVGKLLTRFLLLVNKIPNFADDSSAFSARLVVLRMTNTFVGREDKALTDKLRTELPGILNWALEGYDRLKANGKFTETESSDAAKESFQRAASPTATFVEECCVLDAKAFITETALYVAYQQWCASNGARPDIKTELCEAVLAASPTVKRHRIAAAIDSQRPRGLLGIRLPLPEERAPPVDAPEIPF